MKSMSSEHFVSDSKLQAGIAAARDRTLGWYQTIQVIGLPSGVMRISAAHDPVQWPGMLLPGTYNGLMGAMLIGGMADVGAKRQASLTNWLISQRLQDGRFRISGMLDDAVFKKPDLAETWGYIDFHVTNYSLGALEFVAPDATPHLAFAERFLDPQYLKAWLAERDLRDPWLEGNNIVNLGSFLLLLGQHQPARAPEAEAAMQVLFDWHDRLQEPSTGFWGVGQLSDPLRLLHAMAGSMHNFHLWYITERQLPHQDKAVDYCLTQPPRVHSACIDVDLVDLLVHAFWQIDHRRDETQQWLRALLPELLAFQNSDGGFPDVLNGAGVAPRKQDGWVRGYEEPQGFSNTFSTWFRWIAIAMISECLWPGWAPFAGRWNFRTMPGIGYCKRPASIAPEG